MNKQQTEKLHDIIEGAGEKFYFDHSILSEINVEEIETKPRDGFIPFTDGGFFCHILCDMAHDTGTGNRLNMVDYSYFDEEEEKAYNENPDGPEQVEGYLYLIKIRGIFYKAGNSRGETPKQDHIYLDAYVCKDGEYGRDHISWLMSKVNQTVGTWNKTIPLKDFHKYDSDKLIEEIYQAVN